MSDQSKSTTPADFAPAGLLALARKWRASANGHIRFANGRFNKQQAQQEREKGEIYSVCAAELETLLANDQALRLADASQSATKKEKP